jgi:hypothetical protein
VGPTIFGTGLVTTHTFTNDPGVGGHLAAVAGSATSPPTSFASAGAEAHDMVGLFNNEGSTPAVLTFTFSYSGSSSAAIVFGETAGAGFNFHLTGASDEPGELLEVDTGGGFVPVGPGGFEVTGTNFASASDTITVRYTGAPLTSNTDGVYAFSIFTRANGFANSQEVVAEVPEPASFALWSLGAIGLVAARRFRKKAA